ncbi:hypothetical protein EON82_19950 [bacterium]|nr:MAG: hypothetical protein EON82_19950 [bacterium]
MRSLEQPAPTVPMLDVAIGGILLPRGEAIPLIVQLEISHELRQSGVLPSPPLAADGEAPRNAA